MKLSRDVVPEAYQIWPDVKSPHPMDIPSPLSEDQRYRLAALLGSVPSEGDSFDYGVWADNASRGGDFILSMGRWYASAHCYT